MTKNNRDEAQKLFQEAIGGARALWTNEYYGLIDVWHFVQGVCFYDRKPAIMEVPNALDYVKRGLEMYLWSWTLEPNGGGSEEEREVSEHYRAIVSITIRTIEKYLEYHYGGRA